MILFFSVRGEGKCEINYKKKKFIFELFGIFFDHFWSLVCLVFFFSVRGEGKCEINYKKKKIYFCPFWKLFSPFLVVSFPEKMIRKCFGGKEKE